MSRPTRMTLDDLEQLRRVLTSARDERNSAAMRRVGRCVPQMRTATPQGPADKHEAPPPARGEASTTSSL